jgi:hypothetical protein
MNERFKELAREARLLTGWPVGEVEYQKFAELIVRECADIVDTAISDGGVDGRSLKEHFGVEE